MHLHVLKMQTTMTRDHKDQRPHPPLVTDLNCSHAGRCQSYSQSIQRHSPAWEDVVGNVSLTPYDQTGLTCSQGQQDKLSVGVPPSLARPMENLSVRSWQSLWPQSRCLHPKMTATTPCMWSQCTCVCMRACTHTHTHTHNVK